MSALGSKRPLADTTCGTDSADAKPSGGAAKKRAVNVSTTTKKVTPAAQKKERAAKLGGASIGELRDFISETLLSDSVIGSEVGYRIDAWVTAKT